MNPTTTNAAITQASSVTTLVTGLQQAALNGAKDVPAAVKAISVLDPDLTPKALIASKTPWGTLAVTAVGWAVAKWGLGWDDTTVNVVAGLCVLAGAYAMRYITTARVGGIFSTPPAATPVATS
jgi:hypothetical protein